MEEFKEYKLVEVGLLKYDRIKSISLFKKELNSFDFQHSIVETKLFLDLILENNYKEPFSGKLKSCIDIILYNCKYEKIPNIENEERNFPDNWVAPMGGTRFIKSYLCSVINI